MIKRDEDESNNNGLYLFFAVLVVVLAGVAYARLPAVRTIVDAKAPWFKDKVGHYLVSAKPGDDPQAPGGDAAAPSTGAAGPQGFDLATFAAHPENWPKSIAIKAETEFPAVLNGKQVGTIHARAGTEVHLVQVQSGKLGVEYQGGGKWLAPEATDLLERVRSTPR